MLDIDVWGNDRVERQPLSPEDVERIKTRFGLAWSMYWRDQARQPPYPRRSWVALQRRVHSCLFLAEASPSEAADMIEYMRDAQRTSAARRYESNLGVRVYPVMPEERLPGLAGMWIILRAWETPR